MKTSIVKGIPISALSLGTVQLGVNYGINNDAGKPDRTVAFQILDKALEEGITALDTAAGYGDSEEIIGEWLKTVDPAKRPFVMTKLPHTAMGHKDLDTLRKAVREGVEASKARLGLEQIPLLMLHNMDDYNGNEDNVTKVFEELKANGDILYSGISAYSHHDYAKLADSGFDATQIPMNIFDWCQIENGGIEKLEKSGMMVFVRSVYMQGLVFKDPENPGAGMEFAVPTLRKFRNLCEKFGLEPATLAMSFVLSLPGVHSLVLGSEKVVQVEQNAALLNKVVQLTDEQIAEIRENFIDTPKQVLYPSLWPNAMVGSRK